MPKNEAMIKRITCEAIRRDTSVSVEKMQLNKISKQKIINSLGSGCKKNDLSRFLSVRILYMIDIASNIIKGSNGALKVPKGNSTLTDIGTTMAVI